MCQPGDSKHALSYKQNNQINVYNIKIKIEI